MRYRSFEFKAEMPEGDEPGFSGYASTFGNVDSYGDIIQRGAFARTIPSFLERGLVLWQHQTRVPIGKPVEAREDERGLWVRCRVSDTQAGRDVMTLLRDGVVTSLSIGYTAEGYAILSDDQARLLLGDQFDAAKASLPWWADGFRLLTEIELYEVSPVSFPGNDQAEILGVKGKLPETPREMERFLRDAGWPRAAAVAVTNHGFKGLQRDAGPDLTDLASSMRAAVATLKG